MARSWGCGAVVACACRGADEQVGNAQSHISSATLQHTARSSASHISAAHISAAHISAAHISAAHIYGTSLQPSTAKVAECARVSGRVCP
eukprot:359745-Chlamydomonas_euryale.AAC.4